MNCPTRIIGDKAYITIDGDLGSDYAGESLGKAFDEILDRGSWAIVLDLSRVEQVNHRGVGNLLRCYKRVKQQNGVLMVTPLRGGVKDTFELLKLNKLMPEDQ